jgi:hypothetical protein
MGDNGLLTALHRLSTSLERIHALLKELQQTRRSGEVPAAYSGEPRSAAEVECAEGQVESTCSGTKPQETQPLAGQASGPRVIYGGGPSAFVSGRAAT